MFHVDNNAGRAIAGEVFFAAFLCGLKCTLRRGVELVPRGQQRGSRHCRRGVLRGFLVWIKIHTTAWCGTCFTNRGGPALGGIAGGERSASARRAVREPGPFDQPRLPPHGKTAEGAVLQMGHPPRHRLPPKTSPLDFLLSPFSAAGRQTPPPSRGLVNQICG